MLEEKRACAACVKEPFLATQIESIPVAGEACSYCGLFYPSMPLGSLARSCQEVFDNFYEGTAEEDSVVLYNMPPDGKELSECLEEVLGTQGTLINDLATLMLASYPVDDGQDPDPHYLRRHSLGHVLDAQWDRMAESLRNEARLFNPHALETLERVFGPLITDQTQDGFDLFAAAGPRLGISKLYRARVFQSHEALKLAMQHPERDLGPPPKGTGQQGRMNTRGISVFYGATTPEIALAEVRPPVGSFVLMGAFTVTRRLRLLDLEELAQIANDPAGSLFDPVTVDQATRRDFLANLTWRLTLPVLPDNEDSAYLITQAIADFLATHKSLNLDGIRFRSAQKSGGAAELSGRNVVLFHKASRVARSERKYRQGRTTQIMEQDEDRSYWQPEIYAHVSEPERTMEDWMDRDERQPTLDLDMNSMQIYEVQGVEYTAKPHTVGFSGPRSR